jgi:hypothetical protein
VGTLKEITYISKHLTSPVGQRECEDSVILEYNPANRFPTFRDNNVSPSSRVEVRFFKLRPLCCLGTSETDWLPRDVALYSTETESSARGLKKSWNSGKWHIVCQRVFAKLFDRTAVQSSTLTPTVTSF